MFVPRFLVLPLVLSLGVAAFAAQSTPDDSAQPVVAPPSSQPRLLIGPFQDFRPHDANPPGTSRNPIPLGQSGATCYSIRSYRVTRDEPESDSTRPSGYSTCQPSDRFQVKDADDPQHLLRFR